jgi:hypothetical protein
MTALTNRSHHDAALRTGMTALTNRSRHDAALRARMTASTNRSRHVASLTTGMTASTNRFYEAAFRRQSACISMTQPLYGSYISHGFVIHFCTIFTDTHVYSYAFLTCRLEDAQRGKKGRILLLLQRGRRFSSWLLVTRVVSVNFCVSVFTVVSFRLSLVDRSLTSSISGRQGRPTRDEVTAYLNISWCRAVPFSLIYFMSHHIAWETLLFAV